MTNNICTCH